MSIARVYTAQPNVLGGTIITIEADLSRGLHSFSIVGLAGKAIDESKDRVSAAIKNSGFKSPKSSNHKITISLSPADIKKEGPLFDLPIALAYLIAAKDVSGDFSKTAFLGELALDGSVRPVRGVLSATQQAQAAGMTQILVPQENATEAALVSDIDVIPVTSLRDVVNHCDVSQAHAEIREAQKPTKLPSAWTTSTTRLQDIKGQESAKRGLVIAAAGRHNVLMVGPPGTGKTLLARAFQALLPPLSHEEALEVLAIHSYAGTLTGDISALPPFRSPHHTASHTSLVGGGTHPRPGEVTLAHNGVLFLDEFPEFERRSLDSLRQPLEDRVVHISRVQQSTTFPANFILLAAMNPYRGSEDGTTDYVSAMQETYKNKISGPILDRIDLWLEVPHVPYDTLTKDASTEDETSIARQRITTARTRQAERFRDTKFSTNDHMSPRDIETHIQLTPEVKNLLRQSSEKLNLSPRSYHRVIKVARTIADLDDVETIESAHVLEALQYRVSL